MQGRDLDWKFVWEPAEVWTTVDGEDVTEFRQNWHQYAYPYFENPACRWRMEDITAEHQSPAQRPDRFPGGQRPRQRRTRVGLRSPRVPAGRPCGRPVKRPEPRIDRATGCVGRQP